MLMRWQDSDTGIGVYKDELAGWFKDMNKYRDGQKRLVCGLRLLVGQESVRRLPLAKWHYRLKKSTTKE